ncbi:DUF674 family protein [Medicago truncatula]|uniref:DUF674 family protein n=1 Tax=Medicago truncatula TaxID=3880 RepID=A0A072U0Y7_MEDTR|nr:DUF674 family protein [Medicago truncatula]
MASIQTESVEQVDNVRLRILVDKEKNKVVYAEAGKDFVDALFSFLTLPLGTIARFVAKDSNIEAVKFGSISSLYQSVSNLDQQYLSSLTCKEMLLQPRNSMEDYCRQLKLNIDDTERLQYFVCENWDCRRKVSGCLLSFFRNQKCYCGKVMNREVFPKFFNIENGFVKENATFIISDDLCVMPNVFGASLNLLQKLGVETIDAIEEQAVVDLLKLSLISKTPLTDFFLRKSQSVDNLNLRNNIEFLIGDLPSDEDRQMSVKVTLRKTNEQILFVEAGDDFIDFVFSFLTFPLGGVLHMLQGFSSLSSIDNLYKSFSDLSPDIYLMSEGLKDKLCKPLIAPQFELKNPILPIGAAFLPVNYCHTYYDYTRMRYTDLTKEMVYSNYNRIHEEKHVPFKVVDPKSSNAKSSYAKGPSMYMVTDDLCVSPMSSISTMSLLKRSKVPLSDLEERVIKIGVKEGLSILKASLTSASALTNGLNQLIRTVKVSTSAFSAPEDGAGPESNFEALGINNASSLSVQLPDCSSGTQVLQVPTATLVEELPLPPKIQEKENKTPALALRRSTRKRKASDNA